MQKFFLYFVTLLVLVSCLFYANAPSARVIIQGAEGETGAVRVPILMYHSLLKDASRANAYTISPDTFENDLKYLKEHGFETVVMQDLIQYVDTGAPLPEKPVVITFDDGYLNNLTYALPLLRKYNMKAVISVVGAYVENAVRAADPKPTYAYVTWENLREMVDSGCFEVQNHSYNLHSQNDRKGSTRKVGEALSTYQQLLMQDLQRLQSLLTEQVHVTPTTFTYPFGFVQKDGAEIIKQLGFRATLTCREGQNYILQNAPESLDQLKRWNRPHGISTEKFMRKALGQ